MDKLSSIGKKNLDPLFLGHATTSNYVVWGNFCRDKKTGPFWGGTYYMELLWDFFAEPKIIPHHAFQEVCPKKGGLIIFVTMLQKIVPH